MKAAFPVETTLDPTICLNWSQIQAMKEGIIMEGRTLGIICLVIGFLIGAGAVYIRMRRLQDLEE